MLQLNQMKVGSKILLAAPGTSTCTSSMPLNLSASIVGGQLQLTAILPGSGWLTFVNMDLSIKVMLVTVVP